MNLSKKHKFIFWGTAGCGSRSCATALVNAGVDDLTNTVENFLFPISGPFTHQQGVPEGFENYPIVCLTRNPYSRLVSAFLDEKRQYLENDPNFNYSFEYWLENIYFVEGRFSESQADFFVEEWDKLGVKPDYFIRMEHMELDLKKIKIFENLNFSDEVLNSVVRTNNYANENEYDEYVGNFQKYGRFYNQKNADLVYSYLKHYFDLFGYDKDSWK
jgi:hypothetical protein